jgi:competence protein ComEC
MSKETLDIRIWDVAHGSAAYLKAGQKDVMIDSGAQEGFSPSEHINSSFGRNSIDYMIISHPHYDHIKDLHMIDELNMRPSIVQRPKKAAETIEKKLEEERAKSDSDRNDAYIEDAEIYLELNEYGETPDPLPSEPEWVGIEPDGDFRTDGGTDRGVTFHNYSAPSGLIGSDDFDKLNNLSRATIVNCFGFRYVTVGDLLKTGINDLMDNEDAMDAIEDADVLVAPHHGRESSFVPEFVEHVNPDLTVFSEVADEDDHIVPDEYKKLTNGYDVLNEKDESTDERSLLTTYQHGRIRIQASNESRWEASIRGESQIDD